MCSGHEKDADLGPLITKDAKKRVCELVQSGVDEGASLLLDGRAIKVLGYEKGNFVGTINYAGEFDSVVCTRIFDSLTIDIHYTTLLYCSTACTNLYST